MTHQLVLWNLLLKGKGRIKIILMRLVLWIFCKGEERHKRIQAVSLSFFWQKEKKDTKEFRRLVLRSFGKGKREWKRWIAQVFEQRTFLGRKSVDKKLLERWREKESENFVEKVERYWMMLREDWKIDYSKMIYDWFFIKMLKDNF